MCIYLFGSLFLQFYHNRPKKYFYCSLTSLYLWFRSYSSGLHSQAQYSSGLHSQAQWAAQYSLLKKYDGFSTRKKHDPRSTRKTQQLTDWLSDRLFTLPDRHVPTARDSFEVCRLSLSCRCRWMWTGPFKITVTIFSCRVVVGSCLCRVVKCGNSLKTVNFILDALRSWNLTTISTVLIPSNADMIVLLIR
jgi:hypothetical protein